MTVGKERRVVSVLKIQSLSVIICSFTLNYNLMVKHTTHYIVVETSDSYSDERSAMVVAACLICGIFDSRTRVTHGIFSEYIPFLLRSHTHGRHSAILLIHTC